MIEVLVAVILYIPWQLMTSYHISEFTTRKVLSHANIKSGYFTASRTLEELNHEWIEEPGQLPNDRPNEREGYGEGPLEPH